MRAIRVHEWGGPEGLRVEEIPDPVPGPGQVLVRVGAAALNFPDMLMIKGTYQVKPPLPFTPGMEFAGTVAALGEGVTTFNIGDRVMAQTGIGAFAELALAAEAEVQRIPHPMTDAEAAGFPLVYQTSYFGLAHRGALKPGETVLVHSAAGGVGLAAVQIARAMGAGMIIGTAGSDDKLALIREHGADLAINYETEDFAEIVKQATGGKGADVIYDPVGGAVGERSTKCIAFEGRIVVIGFTSGGPSKYMGNHMLVKNYSVTGLHWGNYKQHDPAMIERAWEELIGLYQSGKLKPVIAGRYAMADAAKAMEFLASRKAAGKIVLTW